MTISGSATARLLESVLDADAAREQHSVELLKKAQDTMKQQGEAMVRVLEASGSTPTARQALDVYA